MNTSSRKSTTTSLMRAATDCRSAACRKASSSVLPRWSAFPHSRTLSRLPSNCPVALKSGSRIGSRGNGVTSVLSISGVVGNLRNLEALARRRRGRSAVPVHAVTADDQQRHVIVGTAAPAHDRVHDRVAHVLRRTLAVLHQQRPQALEAEGLAL